MNHLLFKKQKHPQNKLLRWHYEKQMTVLFVITFCTATVLFAQTKRISGRVTDAKEGKSLPGVTVNVEGTKTAAITDENGNYVIDAGTGKKLVFSFVGMKTLTVDIENRNSINVTLENETSQLSDIVVVGYGTTKKATLTGSVVAVKGQEIVKSPATNVSNSLVGRMPGLIAVQPSGEPGYDGSTLRIRGANTLGDNNALVVVDGIAGRSLERIDPNSIESITILKDASAAIYGAQAANGVILITTKRGKLGKPEITITGSIGYTQPTKLPDMADAPTYAMMLNEIAYYRSAPADLWVTGWQDYLNGGYTIPGTNPPVIVKPTYTLEEIQKFADGSDPWRYPNTDWFEATLKPRSPQHMGNVTVSGGTEAMRYFVSIGARTQEGDYYHSATRYNQYDFRSNIDGKINKNVTLQFDLAGRMEDRNYPTRGAGAIFRMVQRGKPTLPAYWPDGTPGPDIEYGDNPVVISTDASGYDKDKFYVLNSNLKLNINIPWVPGLSISGTAAIDKGFEYRKTWYTPWYLYSWDYQSYDTINGTPTPHLVAGKRGFDDARLYQYSQDSLTITLYGLINYEHKFGTDHYLKLLVGTERRKGNRDYFNAFRRFFPSTSVDQLFAGGNAEKDNYGSGSVSARLNYFGRVNYTYKDKYLAEFVWRYDGSYIFPENSRFGFFPGISVGWRISEENFWRNNISFINSFKLRGSWGQTGNDRINEWQYLATYGLGNFINHPIAPFVTNFSVENQTLYETRIPNPDATWEIANQADIGFDASLFKNKLYIEADYFNYLRSKILVQRNASVPLSAGLTLPPENIGKVRNKGFDFTVTYKDRIGDFNYSVSVNGGYAKNKIIFWDEAPGAPDYQKSTGHPMNTNLYYVAEGVFVDQAQIDKTPHWTGALPGDVIFKDVGGPEGIPDGVIDGFDRIRIDENTLPTFVGGVNIYMQYKGFDLSILVQAATGAVNYINPESGEIGNFLQSFAEDRWTPDNPSSTHPRTFNRGNEYWVGNNNTFWLHKTDYVRLKNLQFGYSLPQSLNQKLGIQLLRFYVSGFNLLTYSPDYKDFDPEASAGSGQSYPLQRVMTAGLTLTF